MHKTVVVGLSGGVDSSVSALLLKEQGYRVIGLFMRNWEEEEPCPATADYEDALCVAATLDIPLYTVNFAKEYWDEVFSKCLKEYVAGYTPNPDILCNREIKFHRFFNKAMELGADYLATGHYCRIVQKGGELQLARGLDVNKDQSYFLYTLKQQLLSRILFPIGDLTKPQVRQLALKAQLVTATKKDSTGICFIGKRNFKEFLSRYIPHHQGDFETHSGSVVGRHDGVAYYTIGQRKGLGIGGAGEAWYVVGKDVERNVIIVEQGDDHPALFHSQLEACDVSWVGSVPQFPLACTAKIRYRSEDVDCIVEQVDDRLRVQFAMPQKAITARQSIVFYIDEICLGGAIVI